MGGKQSTNNKRSENGSAHVITGVSKVTTVSPRRGEKKSGPPVAPKPRIVPATPKAPVEPRFTVQQLIDSGKRAVIDIVYVAVLYSPNNR